MNNAELQLPLQGFTIVEFSTMITASLASMVLADQGARVIKIEPPGTGDIMRHLGSSKGGISGLFANCNRGKESLALDLKSPQGAEVARTLAGEVDVLVTNYRPGVMDKLGLGSDALRAANPNLVFLAITGFGLEGPLGNAPAYDPVVQAQAGYTVVQGIESPQLVRNLICDKITACHAAQAITAALLQRTRTGKGQHIDLSMLDAGLFFMFPDGFMNHTLLDEDVEAQPLLSESIQVTQAKDGAFVTTPVTPAQLGNFYRALGLADLGQDERFSTPEAVMRNIDLYQTILQEALDALTVDEVVARLTSSDVPAAKCLSREEALAQPQITANASVAVTRHALMGSIRQVRHPARFDTQQLPLGRPCPALGEHSAQILREFGYQPAQIDDLRACGALG